MPHAVIQPSRLSGALVAPPSKSQTLRAILLASLAQGRSVILRPLNSPDTATMLAACRALGARIDEGNERLEIQGVAGQPSLPDDVINAGNSGLVLRLIAAVAAIRDGGHVVLTGDASLRYQRPLAPLLQGLTQLGARCLCTKGDGHAPVVISGPIRAGTARLAGNDSQPVSGLLIASSLLPGRTDIHVDNPGERPWVAMTLDWLERLGVVYQQQDFTHYTIQGGAPWSGFEYTVPGDWSSVAYPVVAALVTGSQLSVSQCDHTQTQGDRRVLDILRAMGARLTVAQNAVQVQAGGLLQGVECDINDIIDALPILSVAACYAKGQTRLLNAEIARHKESDRLAVMTKELKKMGARVVEEKDSLTIEGHPLTGATLAAHQDHRVALALSVAAMAAEGASKIEGVDCVAKTYSTFFIDMARVGAAIEVSQ